MKLFNWISRKKANTHQDALESTKGKTVEELRKDLVFLENYVANILNTQKDIKTKIEKIQNKTKQNLKEEQLIKELWVFRYMLLHLLFFNTKTPKDQNELDVDMALINRAFQTFKGTADYLPWFKEGFIEYAGTSTLKFSNLEEFMICVTEKSVEKIPLIAFECTEGRLGGELHDFVIELIMTIVAQDKEIFETGNNTVTEKEVRDIKNVIEELKISREKAGKEFFEDLLGEDLFSDEKK